MEHLTPALGRKCGENPPMLAIPYLLLSFLAALVIVQRFFREFHTLVRVVGAFVISVVLTSWVNFLAAWLLHSLGRDDATFYGSFVAMVVNAAVVAVGWRELRQGSFRVRWRDLLGTAAALAFSGWVMLQRLSGDPLTVSLNTWGDTALHVGIARSFSQGDNFPPVLPIFSGETIRYHFGLDFYAGALEGVGLPIQWAFNLLGALGFTAIMVLVFAMAHHLWRRVSIGVVAVVLFATNGSLAFLRYFDDYPSVTEALRPENWWQHATYEAIGPYAGDEQISIFWTLNPYLTQTHLIVSMSIVLFVGYVLLRHLRGPGGIAGDDPAMFVPENSSRPLPRPRAVALGALSGASFWLNGILFLTSIVFLCALFYVFNGRLRRIALPSAVLVAVSVAAFVIGSYLDSDGLRKAAVVALLGGLVLLGPVRWSWPFFATAGILALPQAIWLNGGLDTQTSLSFHTGYLVDDFSADSPGSWVDFANYWWLNLGLVGPLVILAAIVGRRADRKLLVAVMAIFVFGNIVQLGLELGGHNHKVFNLWEVLVNLFAAYGLVWVSRTTWNGLPDRNGLPTARSRLVGRVVAVGVVPAMCLLLVLSGLLDFMTLKNDPRFEVFGNWRGAIAWIDQNTSRDAVFLTSYGEVYTVPTLAGRPVYLGGFSAWAAGMGYDDGPRMTTIASIYDAPDRVTACARLLDTDADYIQVSSSERQTDRFAFNADLFPGDFVRAYSDQYVSYYDVKASCGSERGLPAPSGS